MSKGSYQNRFLPTSNRTDIPTFSPGLKNSDVTICRFSDIGASGEGSVEVGARILNSQAGKKPQWLKISRQIHACFRPNTQKAGSCELNELRKGREKGLIIRPEYFQRGKDTVRILVGTSVWNALEVDLSRTSADTATFESFSPMTSI